MDQYKLNPGYLQQINFGEVALRCPICRRNGTFHHPLGSSDFDLIDNAAETVFLVRICPNQHCFGQVFVVASSATREVIASYPVEAYDFDATAIPEAIVKTFEEALMCHQIGADTASAMMIRRTLEELCEDRGATGTNLKERIEALAAKITVPRSYSTLPTNFACLGMTPHMLSEKCSMRLGRMSSNWRSNSLKTC